MDRLVESLIIIMALALPIPLHAGEPAVQAEHQHREVYYINGAGLLGTLTNEPCDAHPGIPLGIKAWQATTQDPVEGDIQGCWLWETNGYGIVVYWLDSGHHVAALTDYNIFKAEKPDLPAIHKEQAF